MTDVVNFHRDRDRLLAQHRAAFDHHDTVDRVVADYYEDLLGTDSFSLHDLEALLEDTGVIGDAEVSVVFGRQLGTGNVENRVAYGIGEDLARDLEDGTVSSATVHVTPYRHDQMYSGYPLGGRSYCYLPVFGPDVDGAVEELAVTDPMDGYTIAAHGVDTDAEPRDRAASLFHDAVDDGLAGFHEHCVGGDLTTRGDIGDVYGQVVTTVLDDVDTVPDRLHTLQYVDADGKRVDLSYDPGDDEFTTGHGDRFAPGELPADRVTLPRETAYELVTLPMNYSPHILQLYRSGLPRSDGFYTDAVAQLEEDVAAETGIDTIPIGQLDQYGRAIPGEMEDALLDTEAGRIADGKPQHFRDAAAVAAYPSQAQVEQYDAVRGDVLDTTQNLPTAARELAAALYGRPER
ncbi:MAG: hypothetical protein ABEI97_00890 [Candidatus Nanohaloarchaea archaeon]